MKKIMRLALLPIVLLCLVNAGFQSTEKSDRQPSINFYGTVNGDTAENITVSGLYENIPLYVEPTEPDVAPTAITTHVRLDEIKAIRHNPAEPIRQFNKRDYIVITIEFENKEEKKFVVERSRKIYYDIPFADAKIKPLEQEMLVEALQEVVINGYKERPRKEVKGVVTLEKSAAKEAMCKQAKDNIAALEKHTNGMFNQFVGKIKESVTHLCG